MAHCFGHVRVGIHGLEAGVRGIGWNVLYDNPCWFLQVCLQKGQWSLSANGPSNTQQEFLHIWIMFVLRSESFLTSFSVLNRDWSSWKRLPLSVVAMALAARAVVLYWMQCENIWTSYIWCSRISSCLLLIHFCSLEALSMSVIWKGIQTWDKPWYNTVIVTVNQVLGEKCWGLWWWIAVFRKWTIGLERIIWKWHILVILISYQLIEPKLSFPWGSDGWFILGTLVTATLSNTLKWQRPDLFLGCVPAGNDVRLLIVSTNVESVINHSFMGSRRDRKVGTTTTTPSPHNILFSVLCYISMQGCSSTCW